MNTRRLPSSSSVGVHTDPRTGIHAGYTLFELLAVLTVIGIGLSLILGSYNSWGTAHALTGATRTVEAGLQQARTLAMTQHAYVAFSYTNPPNATLSGVAGFQSFFCNLTNDTYASVEAGLQATGFDSSRDDISDLNRSTGLDILAATPFQRLSGHVRLAHIPEKNLSDPLAIPPNFRKMTLFFRPDGSVFTTGTGIDDTHTHNIIIYTRERFHRGGNASAPRLRLIRIDLSTGLTTLIPDLEAAQ